MVSFLFIISFLLHLITVAALYQLIKKIRKLEEGSNDLDLAVALERSLEDIKNENDRFERLIKEKDHQNLSTGRKSEKVKAEFSHLKDDPGMVDSKNIDEDDDITHLLGDRPGYEVEASIESRVLQLHQEGRTIEEIAKKLGVGKTEAGLIIKMYA